MIVILYFTSYLHDVLEMYKQILISIFGAAFFGYSLYNKLLIGIIIATLVMQSNNNIAEITKQYLVKAPITAGACTHGRCYLAQSMQPIIGMSLPE